MASFDLTLHIGRHKSGTSTTQRFLHAIRPELYDEGVFYPEPIEAPFAHHGLARALVAAKNGSLDRPDLKATVAGWAGRGKQVLVSSEGLQNASPVIVRNFFEEAGFFNARTRVFVYLREQFDYAWSSYSQKVGVQIYAEHFETYLKGFKADYFSFLDFWRGNFGTVTVRIYDRNVLPHGDTRVDFLSILGLRPDQFSVPLVQDEVSPGWILINAKRKLNSTLANVPEAGEISRRIHMSMKILATSFPDLRQKPRFDPAMIEAARDRFRDSNKRTFVAFLDTDKYLFREDWTGTVDPDRTIGLADEHIDMLRQLTPGVNPRYLDLMR